jgi:hypothetical protein
MIDLKPKTLTGDIRDFLLLQVRSMEDPWSKLNEEQQQQKIDAIEKRAEQLVAAVVAQVSGHTFPTVNVAIGKFTCKGSEIKAELIAVTTDANLLHLKDAGRCVLVLADPDSFKGQRAPAKAEPNQAALSLGQEYTQGDGEGFENEPSGLDDEPAGDEQNDDITGDIPVAPEEPKAKKGRVAEHAH